MPIFEYICKDCNQHFEALVLGSRKAECPHCHSDKLDQMISVFSVGSTGGRRATPAPHACCGGGACGTSTDPDGCGID